MRLVVRRRGPLQGLGDDLGQVHLRRMRPVERRDLDRRLCIWRYLIRLCTRAALCTEHTLFAIDAAIRLKSSPCWASSFRKRAVRGSCITNRDVGWTVRVRLAFVVVRPIPGPARLLARNHLSRLAGLSLGYRSRRRLALVSNRRCFRLGFRFGLAPLPSPLGRPIFVL